MEGNGRVCWTGLQPEGIDERVVKHLFCLHDTKLSNSLVGHHTHFK